jgi:UPF0755 protein
MKKKLLIIFIILGIVFSFKESIIKYLFDLSERGILQNEKKIEYIYIYIPEGRNAKEIAKLLESKKIIKNRLRFLLLARLLRVEDKLKSGEYRFHNRMLTSQVIDKLKRGEVVLHKFTIPEGYTFNQIAQYLEEKKLADKDKILSFYNEVSLLKKDQQKEAESLEGYLFPDTYEVSLDTKEIDLVKMMIKRFYEVVGEDYEELARKVGLTLHQALILASLIEKEAKVDEEYRIISSVFHNRLKKKIPLSSCASVIFSLGKHKKKLYYKDLKVDSPYNTYLRVGLPPGPICSPGKKALKAAVEPSSTDYLYFVSLGNGRHKFSKEYIQHIKAKR